MSVELHKETAAVSLTKAMQISLDKGNDPGEIEVELEMFIDTSTSMTYRYRGGRRTLSEMQVTLERNLGLLLAGLDADHKFPLYSFDRTVREIGEVNETNYAKILDDWLKHNALVPATYYLPILEQVKADAPDGAKDANPRVIVVHTDGVPNDHARFKQAIIDYASEPVFWIFMGHGVNLDFLRDLDTMGGRVVDNVALIEVDNAKELSDTEYYDQVVRELIVDWFPAIRKAGITNR